MSTQPNRTPNDDDGPQQPDDRYISIQADDVSNSVRTIVENCIMQFLSQNEARLDGLSFEAQNMLSDRVQHYRKQLIERLIHALLNKGVLEAEDIRAIHEKILGEPWATLAYYVFFFFYESVNTAMTWALFCRCTADK